MNNLNTKTFQSFLRPYIFQGKFRDGPFSLTCFILFSTVPQ